ncbi:NAD-dependent epimerase/dehydratase family protein [Actinotalea sp. Marseille-Q4924]|uniref:NAD-dependent epimerase/dehydratase family protein n=1 Tax=Actinotalea sp. Marseille-Q4924 TaxID=2866571 RepID=UPI001CE43D73|nr:NAD-dependent epimerase/dehydratase family protein [Actinotalea sp. Marseille-Q4924]
MHLLVLGGTGFLSGEVVRAALSSGHRVTAVTRGRRPEPGADAPAVRSVRADRDDVAALTEAFAPVLADDAPDAVVDCCGYTVDGARAAADALAGVPRYVYVSSISAYRDWPPGPVPDESAPTFGSEASPEEYGPMKAQSERVLEDAFGNRLLSARAGLIVGPGDRTLRLTSWLHRIATADRVVVPATGDVPVAFVDVRDLAGWLVVAAGADWSGPVNATGPVGMTTYGGMLAACRDAVVASGAPAAELVPVPPARLLEAGVEPWTDLPFWLPDDVAATAWQVGTARARELGLPSRPIEDTVRDTWRWLATAGLEQPPVPDRVDPRAFA